MITKERLLNALVLPAAIALLAAPLSVWAKAGRIEATQKSAEDQVRRLVEPLLDKYCPDQCKLLSVSASVDMATPETIAPGFDEVEVTGAAQGDLTPTGARIKILMDDKVGPVSRSKLLELVQQYLETLDYPVKIDTQIAHFPARVGSESRVAELRERVIKQFRATMEGLFDQFCPDQCLLADFDVKVEAVNPEEVQYGSPGEFIQEAGVAIRIKDISGTVLVDDLLTPEEQKNVLEMARLKTNSFKNVTLAAKTLHFPHPDYMSNGAGRGLASHGPGSTDEKSTNRSLASDSKETRSATSTSTQSNQSQNTSSNTSSNNSSNTNQSTESNQRQEKYERFEKIERVENGDAVQAELKKFGMYGLIFACAVISLLIFVAMAAMRPRRGGGDDSPISRIVQSITTDPTVNAAPAQSGAGTITADDHRRVVALRYEIERLLEEMTAVFAQHPRVAKQVFSRVLTEEGVEETAKYIDLFGESIVLDMLRDPSLQSDLAELMEHYAKNPIELKDEEKLELLKKLHNRTIAGKLVVMGNRSSNLFDFLNEMDGQQILELIRTESLTVKSIVLTQVDLQKRQAIYTQLEEETRMKLLTELSRIDYLPRDYIFNVANALKRKRRDNPRLNTEALPGSEVLVNLLERTGVGIQRSVVKNLEISAPESARTVKSKLVSLDTLRFLRDGQMLEVVLSLRHDELLQFLKGTTAEVKAAIFAKSPKELVVELEEELVNIQPLSREGYQNIERKVLNRMKVMANEGHINLVETNERMFAESPMDPMNAGLVPGAQGAEATSTTTSIKKVAGW